MLLHYLEYWFGFMSCLCSILHLVFNVCVSSPLQSLRSSVWCHVLVGFSSSPVFWPHVGRYSVVVQFKSQQSVLCRDGGAGRVRDTLNTQHTMHQFIKPLNHTVANFHTFRQVFQHAMPIFMMIFYSSHNRLVLAITNAWISFCVNWWLHVSITNAHWMEVV